MGLLQAVQPVLCGLQPLQGLLAGIFGGLQRVLACFGGLQGLGQCFQLLRAVGTGIGQRLGLLPGVGGGGLLQAGAQCRPLRLPAGDTGCQFIALRLQRGMPGLVGGMGAGLLFALCLQCIQRGAGLLQGGLGGRKVQRCVGRNGRVFDGTAQRAGLSGLQCMAVGFQALDALLLFQQLLLVGHPLFLLLVLGAQLGQRLRLLCGLVGAGLQRLFGMGLLQGPLAALGRVGFQLLPGMLQLLRRLPLGTQRGQAAAVRCQALRLGLLRLCRSRAGLLVCQLGCGHFSVLCRRVLLQLGAPGGGLAQFQLLRGMLLLYVALLFQLLLPAAEPFTQLRKTRVFRTPVLQGSFLRLQRLQCVLCGLGCAVGQHMRLVVQLQLPQPGAVLRGLQLLQLGGTALQQGLGMLPALVKRL